MHHQILSILSLTAIMAVAWAAPLVSASAKVCGVIPTGNRIAQPIGQVLTARKFHSKQSVLCTPTNYSLLTNNLAPADALACHKLCLNTANCQSLNFGLADGTLTCSLFSVTASELAPINNFLAFDINCPITLLDIDASVLAGGIDTNADLTAIIDSGVDVDASADVLQGRL